MASSLFKNRPGSSKIVTHSEGFASCARAAQARQGDDAGADIADHAIVTTVIAAGSGMTNAMTSRVCRRAAAVKQKFLRRRRPKNASRTRRLAAISARAIIMPSTTDLYFTLADSEAERLFGALSDGGAVQMPLTQTFFASKFGMVKDRFGVTWMVVAGSV